MSRKDDLEAYENAQARDLIRLFEAARPTHEAQAPSNFRAEVLHKIEARQSHQGLRSWVRGVFTPAWAPALAAALVLSLGINAWLGWSVWEPTGAGKQRVVDTSRSAIDSGGQFSVYALQAGIQSETALGTLVTDHSILNRDTTAFGFAGKPTSTSAFLIGTLYAEALAYLRSGDRDLAAQRLAVIKQALVQRQTSASMTQFLNMVQSLVEQPTHSTTTLGELLALFEPLYAQDAASHDAGTRLLFRAGAWLETVHLAAAAGDKASLQQRTTVQYFLTKMRSLPVPKGVLETLERLDHILAKPELTDRDIRTVGRLVRRIQNALA